MITSGARFIGPDGDYLIDPDTRTHARMGATKQRVMLAINTALHSSAIRDFGILNNTKMGTTYEVAARNSIRAALKFMTETNEIRIDDIVVVKLGANRTQRTVKYTDLRTGEPDAVTAVG